MFSPHSCVLKLRIPLPPEIPGLSECVRRCEINPPSRRPVGLFGFPASAMILNNAIAKPMLGWEKSPGAGRPRPDLAEGAFAQAASAALAQSLGLGKEDRGPEAAGVAPRAWRESVRGPVAWGWGWVQRQPVSKSRGPTLSSPALLLAPRDSPLHPPLEVSGKGFPGLAAAPFSFLPTWAGRPGLWAF